MKVMVPGAAPNFDIPIVQTLWGVPEPRVELGMGGLEAGTLTIRPAAPLLLDQHTSSNDTGNYIFAHYCETPKNIC